MLLEDPNYEFINQTLIGINANVFDGEEYEWHRVNIELKGDDDDTYWFEKKWDLTHDTRSIFRGRFVWLVQTAGMNDYPNGVIKHFIFVWDDKDKVMYPHYVGNGERIKMMIKDPARVCELLKGVADTYSVLRGEKDKKFEDEAVDFVMAKYFNAGYKVHDSRKKMIEPKVQRIELNNRKLRKQWVMQFIEYGYKSEELNGLRNGLRYHPDVLIENRELNPRGNITYQAIEVELNAHTKRDFFAKLRKAHRTGWTIKFIFADKYEKYHYELYEKFLSFQHIKRFNCIMYCTMSEFKEHGDKAFKHF